MIGGKQPIKMQFARENAHSPARLQGGVARSMAACEPNLVVEISSKISTAHCQYRYPSPSRFGPPRARPASPFRAPLRQFSRCTKNFVVFGQQTADSGRNSNTYKGSKLCLNSVFSLPQLRFSLSPRVLAMTSSAGLPVPQRVPLSLTPLAGTLSRARPLVALPAQPVTNSQASAANTFRPLGRLTKIDRRWRRRAPAAVFHSKDRFPCSRKS